MTRVIKAITYVKNIRKFRAMDPRGILLDYTTDEGESATTTLDALARGDNTVEVMNGVPSRFMVAGDLSPTEAYKAHSRKQPTFKVYCHRNRDGELVIE